MSSYKCNLFGPTYFWWRVCARLGFKYWLDVHKWPFLKMETIPPLKVHYTHPAITLLGVQAVGGGGKSTQRSDGVSSATLATYPRSGLLTLPHCLTSCWEVHGCVFPPCHVIVTPLPASWWSASLFRKFHAAARHVYCAVISQFIKCFLFFLWLSCWHVVFYITPVIFSHLFPPGWQPIILSEACGDIFRDSVPAGKRTTFICLYLHNLPHEIHKSHFPTNTKISARVLGALEVYTHTYSCSLLSFSISAFSFLTPK